MSEVHRGLRGEAYTVFEGTRPEAMEVEILGVLKNALGPNRDMILARLRGSHPEYTGVAGGMSGSPVYIDGKLLGALSYRIGEFSKEPIAGITPIEQMLEVGKHSTVPAPAQEAGASFPSDRALDTGESPVSAGVDIRPIETPLVFSGFAPPAVRLFEDRVRGLGLTPEAVVGGGYSGGGDSGEVGSGGDSGGDLRSAADEGANRLMPGSAVSAMLLQGDLEIAATCSVTFVDPHQVLACGHPITQYGRVSVPMAEAEVVATLPSPLNAFKIINTGRTVGAFTDDRASAIRGIPGATARMIPVSIRTVQAGETRTLHLQMVDNPDLTPAVLMVSLYQALMQNNDYGAELSYSLHGAVGIAGYPELRMDSLVAPTDEIPSALNAAQEIGLRFQKIFSDPARLGKIQGIHLDVDVLPGRLSVELQGARVTQPIAHAGETVTIEATLRPFQGETKNLRIPVHVPETMSAGPLRILLSDAATLDRLTDNPPGVEVPADLNSLIHQLNAARADDRLYVTLLLPDPQAVVDGRTLPAIPLSMANVLEPLRANHTMSLNGESAVPVASIPVAAMLTGQKVVSLEIE